MRLNTYPLLSASLIFLLSVTIGCANQKQMSEKGVLSKAAKEAVVKNDTLFIESRETGKTEKIAKINMRHNASKVFADLVQYQFKSVLDRIVQDSSLREKYPGEIGILETIRDAESSVTRGKLVMRLENVSCEEVYGEVASSNAGRSISCEGNALIPLQNLKKTIKSAFQKALKKREQYSEIKQSKVYEVFVHKVNYLTLDSDGGE